jgi:hypothetical protein
LGGVRPALVEDLDDRDERHAVAHGIGEQRHTIRVPRRDPERLVVVNSAHDSVAHADLLA